MRVLIIEDQPEMAKLLSRGLEEEQFEVSVARDGRTALEMSSSRAFDVILLDVMLPKMNGLEVARELRGREQETPVLMLTARDSLQDIVKGLDARADASFRRFGRTERFSKWPVRTVTGCFVPRGSEP